MLQFDEAQAKALFSLPFMYRSCRSEDLISKPAEDVHQSLAHVLIASFIKRWLFVLKILGHSLLFFFHLLVEFPSLLNTFHSESTPQSYLAMSTATHKAIATPGLRQPLVLIDVPTLSPEGNEVQIRVYWTVSTPFDLHQTDGGLLITSYPHVLGDSVAGIVTAIGPDVKNLNVGDLVFGFTFRSQKERGQQEIIVAPEALLGKAPKGWEAKLEAIVTVPNNFVTVWHTITKDLEIELPWPKPEGYQPAERDAWFLVWGGSSSVGQYAIQLLKYYGYRKILTTASKAHHQMLKDLGAKAVFDYRDVNVLQSIQEASGGNVKYVIDSIGSLDHSIKPISKIAKAGTIAAIMLPIIVRDAAESVTPEYAMDVETIVQWEDGVEPKGVRTHFYLEVS